MIPPSGFFLSVDWVSIVSRELKSKPRNTIRSISADRNMPPDSVPLQESTMTTSQPRPGSSSGVSSNGNPLDEAVDGNVAGGTLAHC